MAQSKRTKSGRGKSSAAEDLRDLTQPRPARGSVVLYRTRLESGLHLGVVVSNNVQNEDADILLLAPLERRKNRFIAPFAVNVGPEQGFRTRYVIRCDWITRIELADIVSIERAQLPEKVLSNLEYALKVSLGFSEVI